VQDPNYLSTRDYGLDEKVPNRDEMNGPSESALGRATQHVMSKVLRRREQRVAAIVGNSANFGYSNAYSSGSTQWSHVDSTPLKDLLDYLDKPFIRPNALVMGRAVWTALSQHPKLLANAATNVRITRQMLADMLEIQEVIVGDGWVNSAKEGQTASKTRIWGKICAGIYKGPVGLEANGTWGYTAQFGSRVAGTIIDPDIGIFGGLRVRAGESVREVVPGKEFGFLFTNVVA
jgi:hypothetical protein